MTEFIKQVLWLLNKAGRAGLRNAEYYIANPKELYGIYEDLITYARENPWKFALACLGVGLGVATIVLPLAIGFGAAGPILGSIAAGWQSSIGSVAAGSAFAVIQSMAMTGTFAAIGGTLIGIGVAIPLIGAWFGSNKPGTGDSFTRLMHSYDAERILHLTAGPGAVLRRKFMKPKPRWFLESKHSRIDGAQSSTEGAERRALTTNSKETWDMVWDRMDAWRGGTVKEYALERFDVRIVLAKPKRCRGEDGFYEIFTDHETDCHPECWCVEDLDTV